MLDVIVIGGGISGCSMLYELSRYQLDVALLEKQNDVGVATTKANSAIVHAGYDPEPGTLMAKYNVEGSRIIKQLCKDLDILYRQCGSFVLGFDGQDRKTIERLYKQGVANGVPNIEVIEKEQLHKMEPSINADVQCALYAPSAAVVNPWELASAQAEMAVLNGAEVFLDTEVQAIQKEADGFVLQTSSGEMRCRYLINAAGTHADVISRMLGENDFTIIPNKGEYHLMDKSQGNLVNHVVFQCPTPQGKGVLVAPTVHGNLIVGPNAEDCEADNVSTSKEGLHYVKTLAARSVPTINFRDTIRNFAGVRAIADVDDFIVGPSPQTKGYFRIAGIKSPGLSSAPAIAKDMIHMLGDAGLALQKKEIFKDKRKVVRFKELSAQKREEAIKQNPLYGTIVCRCETITEGEIVDALHRPLPPRSVDGIKRRCNPGMGRCQGGFCGPRVQAIIARELGIEQKDVPLDRKGMNIITGETKGGGKV